MRKPSWEMIHMISYWVIVAFVAVQLILNLEIIPTAVLLLLYMLIYSINGIVQYRKSKRKHYLIYPITMLLSILLFAFYR